MITAVTEPGDVVWEPFGGLCSASVAAAALGRRAFAAETDQAFAESWTNIFRAAEIIPRESGGC